MNENLDQLRINFTADSLVLLNICLAIIMFGVALEVRVDDFKNLVKNPRPALLGVLSQFFLLPALTFLLVFLIKPEPSVALGMILVAACPGGNISNFMSHLSGGNTALSVSLTGIATILSLFFTPFNLEFWASRYAPTRALLESIALDPFQIFKTVALILIIPLAVGMFVQFRFSKLANKIAPPLKILSILIFMGFVVVAFTKNVDVFLEYIHIVMFLVFIHNAVALITGYTAGALGKLPIRDRRALAIETGIQNSGLGLLLIFSFFGGLGGMALTAAWWGIWHIISGLTLALFWGTRHSRAPTAK